MAETVDRIEKAFRLTKNQLDSVQKALLNLVNTGLNHPSTDSMLPSYVRHIPTGREIGTFLALDLGGTNFRVLQLVFKTGVPVEMTSQTYSIPEEMKSGEGVELFDHIARCLCAFTTATGLDDPVLPPMGFTFSFPCRQDSLTSACLVRWTKGFSAKNVEGKDIVKLLREANERHGGPKMGPVAMLNDTVGTLMSCAYKDSACRIGMIVGTGTNAAYVEQNSRIAGEKDPQGQMVINTEWGSLGDDGSLDSIRTTFDQRLDRESRHPGNHVFEKMMSGLYLGELVRLVLIRLQQNGHLWSDHPGNLHCRGIFTTQMMSDVETNWQTGTNPTGVWVRLGVWNTTRTADYQVVRRVCKAVADRGADLAGAALAVLIERVNLPRVTVGYDGSVCRRHPTFLQRMEETTRRLVRPDIDFKLTLSGDGSGIGAALTAAQLSRHQI